METHILEGTLTQVQEQLRALPLPQNTRVRLLLEEVDNHSLRRTERNGVALIPRHDPGTVVTSEFVYELADGE